MTRRDTNTARRTRAPGGRAERRARLLQNCRFDRAAGTLVGQAVGDAIGVPYEFVRPALRSDQRPVMLGGGLGDFAPGEYSDDTSMALCIAHVAATGRPLHAQPGMDAIAHGFMRWFLDDPSDVGVQTAQVLNEHRNTPRRGLAEALRQSTSALHQLTGRSAGNGSLMRTAPVALAYLHDRKAMAVAARRISELTHHDLLAGDACVLWTSGIGTAVLNGTFDGVRTGLALLPKSRRAQWSRWLDEAEAGRPEDFTPNGYVVRALQAAWSAITTTPVPHDDPAGGSFACEHLERGIEAAVRAGDDTDTVAAIAGALLGARWGVSAIPADWQRQIHGWPGYRADDLVRLAILIVQRGKRDSSGWPLVARLPAPVWASQILIPHPHDGGVLLGSIDALQRAGIVVDAVISLCRLGRADQIPAVAAGDHIRVWLIDSSGANLNPHYTVDQAARMIVQLRSEGKRVLLHCAAGLSRTPIVAARYSGLIAEVAGLEALAEIDLLYRRGIDGHNDQLLDAVTDLLPSA